ncbi:HAD family hydrolase [Vineibacter terrae]|uniref:HAD family hydrolase n=1 Tax=Vineibacter terrae TaxID=2586908 RepID=UPI002E333790|nr:HAD hydrolase-like protein [Vineibacter terrae]HEX2884799.1 HAD hydrolase-like protein [Vineibacter terrae]
MTGLSAPRALIFDWDNTLVDTWGVITTCYNVTLGHFGMSSWTEAQTRERAHKSLRDTFPTLFGDRWEEARTIFFRTFDAVHLERLRPKDGAEAMLDVLSSRGLYLAVVSNKTGSALRKETAHLGWDRFFGRIVGATDAPYDKPAPDPVMMALQPAALAAGEHVWFVGDTAIDLECAHNTGCVPVLLRDDTPTAHEFVTYPPRLHVRNCHALLALI